MDILIEASQEVAPKRTKRKAKHMNIWNDEIAIAFKNNKKALYEWKLNGKPQYGPFKDQKTSTKAKLRGAQRRESALQRNMNMILIFVYFFPVCPSKSRFFLHGFLDI
jgi:hypothetical protein